MADKQWWPFEHHIDRQFTAGFGCVPADDRWFPPQDAPCLRLEAICFLQSCLLAGSLAGLLAGVLPEGHPSLPLGSPDVFLRCHDSNWWGGRGGGGGGYLANRVDRTASNKRQRSVLNWRGIGGVKKRDHTF